MSPGARVRTASDVRIRLVEDREGARLAAEVADRVWGMTAMVPTEIVIAAVHAGGYAAVLWEDDEPVGSAFGFLGHWHDGRLSLHSHLAGVLPARAGRGHGEALKRHQWRWARERGLEAITWTFDPLVRRNAVFNLVKLGARVTAYHEDFYGEIHDGINAGERTDRLVVRWEVAGDGAAGHGGADGDGPRGVLFDRRDKVFDRLARAPRIQRRLRRGQPVRHCNTFRPNARAALTAQARSWLARRRPDSATSAPGLRPTG